MNLLQESRYDRQERISWWDQSKLANAKVLVVGAGALGNELVKNLALVGVGSIDIVDMDSIERSNLARCALFRDADEGRPKAEALASAARQVNPTVRIQAYVCSVQSLGTTWFSQYDVILAGLDSREARLWVNAACRRTGRPWIDGAIEGLQGLVRMFDTHGPCYDCTLGEAERVSLSHRRSCALLSPDEIIQGKTPTNATTASIVAAVEVQEAIKLIVGRDDLLSLRGKVWRFEGESMLSYVMEYVEDPDCMSHEELPDEMTLAESPVTLDALIRSVSGSRGQEPDAVYFLDDFLVIDACTSCGDGGALYGLRPLIPVGSGRCSQCGTDRPVRSYTSLSVDDPLVLVPMESWQWPRLEPVIVRIAGDYAHVSLVGEQ